jgi:uncharacterized protein
VRLLQKHTVPHGVLTVVSEQTLLRDPADYISFLLELGVKDFSFLPVRPQNRITTGKGSRPANGRLAAYTRFMQRVFDVWLELDDPSINVRELSSIVSGLAGAKPAVCTLAGSCIGRYFHIEPNGDTYHCDKYLSDPTYRVGNVRQQTFAEIRNGEKLQRLIAQENAKLEKLRACPSYAICHGGCPHDRYIAEKYVPDYDGSCCGMHPLIEHVAGRIEHTLDAPVAMS